MTPTPDEPALELPGLVRDKVAEGRRKASATRARKAASAELAEVDPVARVLLEVPLAHLDRAFDYTVPASMADDARPGTRVKVRFAGKDVDGFIIDRHPTSDHDGVLSPLRRLVSPEPVLAPEVAELCRRVAERYAGVGADVRRLAVPPRHATTEQEPTPPAPPLPGPEAVRAAHEAWAAYPAAAAFLGHLARGEAPRAVWGAGPGEDWPLLLAHLAAAALAAGRGSVLCVPDHRDVARLDAALSAVLGEGHHVTLGAESGPAARYRDFLAVRRGARRIVVGSRSAAFAPVHDLGLVVIWDDGDDLHAEPRAPYPHTREVLLLRSEQQGAAALVGGFARTVEADQLLRAGWAREIALPRAVVRERALVAISGATDTARERDPHAATARIPREAHQALRWGLERGPVLVQTPRAGYALRLACERCRTPAQCRACTGPLTLAGPTAPPRCRWCATEALDWSCPECGAAGLRAPVLGDARTADELGRSFPAVPVLTSSGERIRAHVDATPRIVVATPGAEPVASGGYAVVLLLDTWWLLSRDSMRAAEEAVRRWCNAIGLLRVGGRALAVGDPASTALQALVRWDPAGFAAREADERREAHLPPAARIATLTGNPGALDDVRALLQLPEHADVLGPVPTDDEEERLVVRVPRVDGARLSAALAEAQRLRSSRKLEPVRVQVDPGEILG
ncbi:primosomal protein N' [Nocardioides sp. zg-536]|uniref:Probable replication restart protein PriA n=1 Tax=Nocardioides faecalis TaxID=2803858 RepID=A0A938Y7C8_9ACTN|nr:primosomal protein N' [Nocardioides faecalis]MBM9458841.1 primosomal protein N' [Nocardioides faecalis]QVI60247.1 primosomal protein N' [Nocardioides faecalis]